MYWQYTPYGLPLVLAAIVSLTLGYFTWRRRATVGATPFALLMFAVAEWTLGYALQLASAELDQRIFWLKVQYVGAMAVPLLWTVFATEYTGHEGWLSRRNLALISVLPALILALVWSHPTLGLHIEDNLRGSPEYQVVMFEYLFSQTYWWLSLFYSYLFLLAGTLCIISALVRSRHLYRGQMGALLAGALIPWGAHTITLIDLNPYPELELTPFAFTLSGITLAWGIFRYRLLDIVPTARFEVVEHMNDAIIVLDTHNRVVDFNPAAERILDFTTANPFGKPAEQVFNDTPLDDRGLETIRLKSEILFSNDEGEAQYFELYISPLYRRNNYTGRLLLLHEITERKRAEAERESLIEELDAFAHTVAHDLKSPLSLIISFSQMLRTRHESMTKAQREKFLRRIEQSGHKMSSIIDELYLLASVRKQEDIQTKPLAMGEIVAEAIQRLDLLIEEYQAEIALPDDIVWPAARGHGPWVEEVWVNYLSNAIKYGSNDKSPPYVEIGAEAQQDGMVRFWVRDYGPGLTPEQCKQLFRPFTRLGQIKAQGQGLGLSIVHRIITRLGGEIGVESQIDKGSTFIFTLPANPPHAASGPAYRAGRRQAD